MGAFLHIQHSMPLEDKAVLEQGQLAVGLSMALGLEALDQRQMPTIMRVELEAFYGITSVVLAAMG
jgi:hypothetical protein